MQSKEHLIDAFYTVKSRDIATLNSLIDDIETYLSKEGSDAQLSLVLHTLHTYVEDTTTSDFMKCCEATAPIIKALHHAELGLFEFDILVSAIGYIASYSLTVELAQKALIVLDKKFADTEHYEVTKLQLCFNLSQRLLRAKCFDKVNPGEVRALFDQYIKSAIAICEKKGFATLRIVLMVRNAVFYGVYNDIINGLKALESTKDEAWIKTTKDEVVEYLYHIDGDGKLPTHLLNIGIGHQIRRRRMEIGMSASDLADAIGSSPQAVNEFERGAKGVRPKRLCEIAKTLNVDISYLYGDVKNPTDTVTDPTIHAINKLLSNMCDTDKQYVLDFIRGIIKRDKVKSKGK